MDIAGITIGEIAGWGMALFLIVSSAIQISPLEIDPWTVIARAIGRAINGETYELLDNLESKIDKLEGNVQQVQYSQSESEARLARARILRFGDEIYQKQRHSKEHFDDVLADITDYDNYCAAHPEFKNQRTKMAEQQIIATYQDCQKEHSFLE